MRTVFILNPHAGHNRRRPELRQQLREFATACPSEAVVEVTEGPGHARELATAAVQAGAEVVAAVGGDGTMNEVAQGLLGAPAALALVPCGSGNGLALHLRIPRSLTGALRLAADPDAAVREIDSGEVAGLPFFNAMGIGLDAEISRRFNRLTRRGLPAYLRAGWGAWQERRPVQCTLEVGSERRALSALLVSVLNSDQYGNHARVAPGAEVDDGELDLVAVTATGLLRVARLMPHLFLGSLDSSVPGLLRRSARRFALVRPAPGPLHTDGEVHPGPARLEVVIRPRSLRVLVPGVPGRLAAPIDQAARSFALLIP
ncbi:MAG: YegS/Rv2252/BmrU family lipid kinase [Verrucomicrobia bacterium]|nr:YegS/Rv2252/BmrU family lipid kinase [Verrucomicrobiota bacterium]